MSSALPLGQGRPALLVFVTARSSGAAEASSMTYIMVRRGNSARKSNRAATRQDIVTKHLSCAAANALGVGHLCMQKIVEFARNSGEGVRHTLRNVIERVVGARRVKALHEWS